MTSKQPLFLAALTSDDIRDAFMAPFPPVPVTAGYRLRLVGVLAGLVLLQALYLALIALVVGLTVAYTAYVLSANPGLSWASIAIYVGPPAIGLIATVFLLKPIVIRPSREPEPPIISQASEPLLFEFVERLCSAVGAPIPCRIHADLRVNASAAVDGWIGFFTGRLVLTVGLPLAAGMTVNEFAGVLAHEFGHFSQRAGMRSYFLIQNIQTWFARVVHQRDHLDEWLERKQKARDWRIKAIANGSQCAVDFGRWYLTLLMRGAAWISATFSRQMEFGADRYETAVVGPDVFEQTLRSLLLLEAAWSIAWQDTGVLLRNGKLPENLPALVMNTLGTIADESLESIIRSTIEQQTAKFDSHPCMADRIANSRHFGAPGIFHLDGQASALFADFEDLGRRVSTMQFKRSFGDCAERAERIAPEAAILDASESRAGENAIEHLFQHTPNQCVRWFKLPSGPPLDRNAPHPVSPAEAETGVFDYAVDTSLLQFAALMLVQNGVKVNAQSFRLIRTDIDSVRRSEAIAQSNVSHAAQNLRENYAPLLERLETVASRYSAEAAEAWEQYSTVSGFQDELLEIRRLHFATSIVRSNGRLMPVGICANLIEELQQGAEQRTSLIIERLGSKFRSAFADQSIDEFLERVESIAVRALGLLANLTLRDAAPNSPGLLKSDRGPEPKSASAYAG